MSDYVLTEAIINLSVSDGWAEAVHEWELSEIYDSRDPQTCLCGHYPINEVCVIVNNKNDNKAEVGNCCIKKFMGLPSRYIMREIKKVFADITKPLSNRDTLEYLHHRGVINKWEVGFCFDTRLKRKLTTRQLNQRVKINRKVLKALVSKYVDVRYL